jgi:hypothetical protein
MKQKILRFLGRLLSSGAVLVFVGLIILLAVKSFPVQQASIQQANISSYPAPEDVEPTLSSLSPEVLCDQWFSYRKGQPEDQRAMIEEDYKNCVNARKTLSPMGMEKPTTSAPLSGEYSSPLLQRPAGIGTIIETNFSPLNSYYKIMNQWVAKIGDTHIIVYAGGQQSDSASGDTLMNNLSWPGVVVVSISDKSGRILPEKGGVFLTPQNFGAVRIVNAEGTILTLVANNGSSFSFDAADQKFFSTVAGNSVTRSIGEGTLIESSKVQYQLDGFEFINQWRYNVEGVGTVTIFAGNEQSDTHKGVLLLLVSSPDDDSKVLEEVSYRTNLEDGALRIIDVEGEVLTLVSESGLVYEFDLAKRKFISLPSGSKAISVIPLIPAPSGSGSRLLSVTSTPTRTPTPRPTRTPLPTYNPYP